MLDLIYNYGSFVQFIVMIVFYLVISVCAIVATMAFKRLVAFKTGEVAPVVVEDDISVERFVD